MTVEFERGPAERAAKAEVAPPRSLGSLPAGAEALVQALDGGQEFRSRAANLGFTLGASVRVVQNYGRGPMLVALRGTLVALGRGEAARVLVRARIGEQAA
jgi:ferrous iron transport protein A